MTATTRSRETFLGRLSTSATRFAGEQAIGFLGDLERYVGRPGPDALLWLKTPVPLGVNAGRKVLSATVVSRTFSGLQLSALLDSGRGELFLLNLGNLGFDGWKTLSAPVPLEFSFDGQSAPWSFVGLRIGYVDGTREGSQAFRDFDQWILYLKKVSLE